MTPVPPEGSDSTSSNGSTDEPRSTITRWSQDLNEVTIEFDSSRPDGTFTVKGRCTRCWGDSQCQVMQTNMYRPLLFVAYAGNTLLVPRHATNTGECKSRMSH